MTISLWREISQAGTISYKGFVGGVVLW